MVSGGAGMVSEGPGMVSGLDESWSEIRSEIRSGMVQGGEAADDEVGTEPGSQVGLMESERDISSRDLSPPQDISSQRDLSRRDLADVIALPTEHAADASGAHRPVDEARTVLLFAADFD